MTLISMHTQIYSAIVIVVEMIFSLHEKWIFLLLRIYLVNAKNSAENCEFVHVYWINH